MTDYMERAKKLFKECMSSEKSYDSTELSIAQALREVAEEEPEPRS